MNYQNKFVIYTTGLSSWGSKDIIDVWFKGGRRDNILSSINERFTNIYIYHYDPLLKSEGMELADTKDNIIKYINDNLSIPKNSRIKEELFIIEPFNYLININFDNPYIIIDSAHLFNYNYNSVDKHYLLYNNYYDENKSTTEKIKNVKSIYIPYPLKKGNPDNIWEEITYFKIDENNNVITFSEKLLERGYTYTFNPTDILEQIFNKIKKSIYVLWRVKYIRVGQYFDTWFHEIKPNILKQLCANIFNDSINKENFEKYENYNIIFPDLSITEDIV